MPPRAILLDVEGTTTPVTFVYDVLFPYARAGMREFLARHADDAAVREDLARLCDEHRQDWASGNTPPVWPEAEGSAQLDAAVAYVHWLMDRDRKSGPLKSLQGKVWEQGYRTGELRGQVYEDVPRAFARWKAEGKDIAIFSSGSVLAQQLLFGCSTSGDLRSSITAYFDTSTGAKTEPESYRRIALAIELSPVDILFLSDVVAELDAAAAAGVRTALTVRPGRTTPDGVAHPVIHTFDDELLA